MLTELTSYKYTVKYKSDVLFDIRFDRVMLLKY